MNKHHTFVESVTYTNGQIVKTQSSTFGMTSDYLLENKTDEFISEKTITNLISGNQFKYETLEDKTAKKTIYYISKRQNFMV